MKFHEWLEIREAIIPAGQVTPEDVVTRFRDILESNKLNARAKSKLLKAILDGQYEMNPRLYAFLKDMRDKHYKGYEDPTSPRLQQYRDEDIEASHRRIGEKQNAREEDMLKQYRKRLPFV